MYGRTLHILLVEDNLHHAELVRRGFEQSQITCSMHHVEDGEAALDYIFGKGAFAERTQFPAPDLVLLDLRLPRVDGLEVLRHVKSHPTLHSIPIVVLTTSDAERDVAAAYENHVNSFVTKPVDFQRLLQLIKDLGIYWLSWNKAPQPGDDNP